MNLTLYQTLEDRENPDQIEQDGPFKCDHSTAWLGSGYYFWETHVEFGHFWGKKNHSRTGYVVCRANGKMDDQCFDLHGNPEHRQEFEKIADELVKDLKLNPQNVFVNRVISHLKKIGIFKYNSIRALGTDSMTINPGVISLFKKVFFRSGNHAYLDLRPQIQICLVEKKALSLHNYMIVYPDKYTFSDYA